MLAQDPWGRTADMVTAHYIAHPELIQHLLERVGANHVRDHGREFRSTCPLHASENKQSFAVWFDKGYVAWRCHTGCAAKGNLYTLLMRKYNVGFEQAVTWAAKAAGMQISGPALRISHEQLQEESLEMVKRRLGIRQNDAPVIFSDQWLQQSLAGLQTPAAATAIDFLTGPHGTKNLQGDTRRGFKWDVIQRFELGFVPAKVWTMPDPENPAKMVGYFEDRLVTPWRDWDGRLIGFAGRRLDGQNYVKWKTFKNTRREFALYGLHLPEVKEAIAREKHAILVEGYSDVWRAWSLGIYNVICVGGTDLTPHQVRLLMRFDLRMVTIYLDGDEAGLSCGRRMCDHLQGKTVVRLGHPPVNKDPDDLASRDEYLAGVLNAKRIIERTPSK